MSVPISAMITSAVRRWTPGIVQSSVDSWLRKAQLCASIAVRELGDLLVEEVEVSEDRADDQRVMGIKAALERFAQRGESSRRSLPLREVGEHLRVGGAGNERVEHRPARLAEDVARRHSRA